jgi:hypothetical protein
MGTTNREELQEDFLSTLRKGQDIALDALKVLVETIQFVTPARPAVNVRLIDRLPKPHQVVADGYDFAEHLLANQRQFADEVITTMSPLLAVREGEPEVASGEGKSTAHSKKVSAAA